jgi:hypothetical protein
MAEATRIELGFDGGQVVSVRLSADALDGLRRVLASGGWHDLETEDGTLAIQLGKVVFIRADTGEHRVGFATGADG